MGFLRKKSALEDDYEKAIEMWRRHEPVIAIGQAVVYIPESIVCKVTGYRWMSDNGKGVPPIVYKYQLDIGLGAARHLVKKYPDRMMKTLQEDQQ